MCLSVFLSVFVLSFFLYFFCDYFFVFCTSRFLILFFAYCLDLKVNVIKTRQHDESICRDVQSSFKLFDTSGCFESLFHRMRHHQDLASLSNLVILSLTVFHIWFHFEQYINNNMDDSGTPPSPS